MKTSMGRRCSTRVCTDRFGAHEGGLLNAWEQLVVVHRILFAALSVFPQARHGAVGTKTFLFPHEVEYTEVALFHPPPGP